jgi:hypothetical protein
VRQEDHKLEVSLGYMDIVSKYKTATEPSTTQQLKNNPILNEQKKGWGCRLLVECLPSMHRALGLILSTEKK